MEELKLTEDEEDELLFASKVNRLKKVTLTLDMDDGEDEEYSIFALVHRNVSKIDASEIRKKLQCDWLQTCKDLRMKLEEVTDELVYREMKNNWLFKVMLFSSNLHSRFTVFFFCLSDKCGLQVRKGNQTNC